MMKSFNQFILEAGQFSAYGNIRYGSVPATATNASISGAVTKALASYGTPQSASAVTGKTGVTGSGSISYSGSVGSRPTPSTPSSRPAARPSTQSTAKPIAKPVTKPQSATKPAAKPVEKPAAKPVEKPAAKPVENPTIEKKMTYKKPEGDIKNYDTIKKSPY